MCDISRYAGQMEHPLYYDEREKGVRERGGGMPNAQRSYNRSQQLAPTSPRYGGRNGGYPRERHTVDRERFPKYMNHNEVEDSRDEDMPVYQPTPKRNDRFREMNEMGYSSPGQQRHLMRHSEDRQVTGFSHMRQSTRERDRSGAGQFSLNFCVPCF